MPRIAAFQIVYDSSTCVFTPGQLVSGHVLLNIKEAIEAKALVLHVIGKAYTSWNCAAHTFMHYNEATKKQEQKPQRNHIVGNETYLEDKCELWNFETCSSLQVGTNKLDFSFTLPGHCPPSYEGQIGYVRYYCKAILERPSSYNKTALNPFTVLPNFDLNTVLHASSPMIKEDSKNLGFIIKHGRLDVKARIQKIGFVPGEFIELRIDINNKSTRGIELVEAKLLEISHYEGFCSHYTRHQATKKYTRTIEKTYQVFPVPSKDMRTIFLTMRVPSIVPTFHCQIINAKYISKVKIDANGYLNNTMELEFPIYIGTHPTDQRSSRSPSPRPLISRSCFEFSSNDRLRSDTNVRSRSDTNTSWLSPPTTPTIVRYKPPPSYAECMLERSSMSIDDEDLRNVDTASFTPRYLYYPSTRSRSTSRNRNVSSCSTHF